ncbi:MAG: phage holin family protein [Patescibacteria group bacterium]
MRILQFFVSVIAICVAVYLVPGAGVTFGGAIVLAIVLGIINLFIKPIVTFIALPITILTLGLFSLIINALFILLAAKIVPGFYVTGFWSAFWFSIVLSIINTFFHWLIPTKKSE